MSNIQLKGNHPSDPWWVVEGTPQEIAGELVAVFPSLSADDPTQFPSLVAKARELWAAQVTVAHELGGQEVAVQRQVPQQPAPWGAAPQQQAQPAPYQAAPQGAPGQAPLDQFGKPMVYKEGISKTTGKPWRAWMGDYRKGDPQGAQVKAQWL